MLTQVVMLKRWGNNVRGDVASFDQARAEWLVANGFARIPGSAAQPPATETEQEVDQDLEVHGLTDRDPELLAKAPTGPRGHKMVKRGRTKG